MPVMASRALQFGAADEVDGVPLFGCGGLLGAAGRVPYEVAIGADLGTPGDRWDWVEPSRCQRCGSKIGAVLTVANVVVSVACSRDDSSHRRVHLDGLAVETVEP